MNKNSMKVNFSRSTWSDLRPSSLLRVLWAAAVTSDLSEWFSRSRESQSICSVISPGEVQRFVWSQFKDGETRDVLMRTLCLESCTNKAGPVCPLAGLHREAERRDPGCGDSGVRMGVHPPHRHHRQHDACWSGWEVWSTQHWRPDHDHKRDESGGLTTQHLPEHHQGTPLLSAQA